MKLKPSPTSNKYTAHEIAIYTRVSTEEQAVKPEGSLDNQAHRCCQHLLGKGFPKKMVDRVSIYREEGFSGKDTNRPELRRLLTDIRAGKVKLLVFTELSRISRSIKDFLTLSDFLEQNNVEFVSLRENFDTSTPHGRLIMVVLMALNQFERENTSLRTSLSMKDRAEKGLFNGGHVPLGYDPDPDRKGHLIIVDEEARIIREAFKLYLEKGSIPETARILKERGYKRKSRISRRGKHHNGGPLVWTTVQHILQNPTYLGLKEINRKRKNLPPDKVLVLPESDRYRVVPAKWEPIIDENTFNRVQVILAENRVRTASTISPKDYVYVLQGIIRCGTCGNILEGASSHKQMYHYYRHPSGKKGQECGPSGWQAEVVEEAVINRLSTLSEDKELLEQIIQKANERIQDATPGKAKELSAAKSMVDSLIAENEGLIERLMDAPKGSVPVSFWARAKELESQIETAKDEVSRITLELEEIKRSRLSPESYREALKKFREVYEALDPLQRSDLLAYLLDKVEITGSEMTIALLGQVPETGQLKELGSVQTGYSLQSNRFSRLRKKGAAVVCPSEFRSPVDSVGESPRQRMLRERQERKERRMEGPSPASQSLHRAILWQEEISSNGTTRAGIARREGLSRARVTQILTLLGLPEEVKAKLLSDDKEVMGWSVRKVLGMVN